MNIKTKIKTKLNWIDISDIYFKYQIPASRSYTKTLYYQIKWIDMVFRHMSRADAILSRKNEIEALEDKSIRIFNNMSNKTQFRQYQAILIRVEKLKKAAIKPKKIQPIGTGALCPGNTTSIWQWKQRLQFPHYGKSIIVDENNNVVNINEIGPCRDISYLQAKGIRPIFYLTDNEFEIFKLTKFGALLKIENETERL